MRVLARIDTEQLGKIFIEYAKLVFGNRIKEGDVVAFDGKRNETQGNSYGQRKHEPGADLNFKPDVLFEF